MSSAASSPSKVTLGANAFAKLMLHAAKHPAAPVCGLLLGKKVRREGASAGTKGLEHESKGADTEKAGELGVDIRVEDVAPLFHTGLVAPTLEAATMMVEQCCAPNGNAGQWAGLVIVGCYSANVLTTSRGVTAVISRVGQAIRKKLVNKWGNGAGRGGASPILVVDNGKFGGGGSDTVNMFSWSERDGNWTKSEKKRWDVEGGFDWAEKHRGKEGRIVDFDDHLDDVTLDFRNPWL